MPTPAPRTTPRLVATDLDGTLLRSDGTISPRTRAALAAAEIAGIEVVFVTARPPRWLGELHDAVGTHGVVICANGAAVVDVRAGTVLAERAMRADQVASVAALLRAHLPSIRFAVERWEGIGAERGFAGPHGLPSDATVADDVEHVLSDATYKLLATCPSIEPAELLDRVAGLVGDLAVLGDSGASGLAELTAPGVTKAATLASWAAERGYGPADVWAFGDAPNDLPMLTWAGTSFAVAGAHPAVAATATHRCGGNDDDGVATELERAVAGLSPRR